MSLYYLDTSAALKLLAQENDSTAFAAFYDAHTTSPWVSSALLRIEHSWRPSMPSAIPRREVVTPLQLRAGIGA